MNVRTVARTVASAAVFAVVAANAASNPLEASYYQGKPAHEATADARSARYADTSPLAPTFYQGKPNATFAATAARIGRAYVDANNPLDPSYRAK